VSPTSPVVAPTMPRAPVPAYDDLRTARFEALRVTTLGGRPAADAATIDVAVLDMNHRAPNVGHDAIVAIVRDAALEAEAELARAGRRVRVLSYPVRDALVVPAHDGRHALYLGTGGPGHLDPRRNTTDRGMEEIAEDPSWETPLFRLFDDVLADPSAALYAVCHSFGLLCRWSHVAEPRLRDAAKGGKTSGVGTNLLTPAAIRHPWFAKMYDDVDGAAIAVLDSRYYDLIPAEGILPDGMSPIAFETDARGRRGEALTMLELARDRDGATPRIFGVNSHPEITAPERVQALLQRLLDRGAIDVATFKDRIRVLPALRDDRREERLLAGRYVFGDLVRDRLARLARRPPAA